ncbi:MAG: NifB/NifX family molybdenum-iron cluster-binding protein [Dehalococcoidales bacterium]
MRCAVPVTGGLLAQHFGHCEHFAFIDIDEGRGEIIKKEMVTSPGHEPGLLPAWLAEEGVTVVIAGGMGSRAQGLFERSGIKVVINVMQTEPEKAVMDYLAGELKIGEDICDH